LACAGRWRCFFVPALAVRYGVNFGTPLVAAAAGGLIVLAAVWYAARDALLPVRPGQRLRLLTQLSLAAAAGLTVAYAALRWYRDTLYEGTLLRGVIGFLVTAIVVCAVTDKHLTSIPRRQMR
jgi:peptidoglycan biosynthesis protein MviN/MurJ (putative lipid II flippase)